MKNNILGFEHDNTASGRASRALSIPGLTLAEVPLFVIEMGGEQNFTEESNARYWYFYFEGKEIFLSSVMVK